MNKINLNELSSADLKKLISDAETALANRIEADKADTLIKINALAAEYGFSLDELMKNQRKGRKPAVSERSDKRSKVAVKYRDPENLSNVWTGRGITPQWLKDYEAQGQNRSEFLIR